MVKNVLMAIVLMLVSLPSSAQIAKSKAMLTTSFIRYLGWSETARQGDFVIGVLKDKEFASWLESHFKGKKFGFQEVVVKNFKSIDDVTACQVLYVSSSANFIRNSKSIGTKVGKDALVVTEEPGATDLGATINFVVRGGNLQFELSKRNAQLAHIQISQKLESMPSAINL